MSSTQPTLLCRYRYDPLDWLINQNKPDQPAHQRFYCKSRLATEIQGAFHHSIVQYEDLLLAQQQRQDDKIDTTLFATDLQRSVLQTLEANYPPRPIAYSPYGHHSAESGLTSLLCFNGERQDPVTGHYLLGNGYRAFNPVLMRFNSPDSLSPFGKGGLNSYVYCLWDPINRRDSSGHMSFFSAGKEIIRQLRMMKNTGTIQVRLRYGRSLFDIRPGADRVHALKEGFRFSDFHNLASPINDQNVKFMHDLSEVRMRSKAATEITGVLPSEDQYLNFLESIKRERPLNQYEQPFDENKLLDLAYGDARGPSKAPHEIRQMADNYYQEMKKIKPYNAQVFRDEANEIFKRNFRIRYPLI